MKKLLLTLGATVSVVAPMATVVACGDKAEAPAGADSNVNQEAYEDFTIDYTIDERTTVLESRTGSTEFEINIKGFDADEITNVAPEDILLASMHLMNQIVYIVQENSEKDLTAIIVNGTRIDNMDDPEDRYYGLTLQEILDINIEWHGGIDLSGTYNIVAGIKNGGVINPITDATIRYLDTFWRPFISALGIEDSVGSGSEFTVEDMGGTIEGTKLIIDGDQYGVNWTAGTEFEDKLEASRVAASPIMLGWILDIIEPAQLDTLTSLVIETNDKTTEVIFADIIGDATLTDFVASIDWDTGNEDHQAILDVNPMDAKHDSYFAPFELYANDDDEYPIDGWREGTSSYPTIEYRDKYFMVLNEMLSQFNS